MSWSCAVPPFEAAAAARSCPPSLRVHAAGTPGRAAVEDFIRRVFLRRFGADLRQFAPLLVSLHDVSGELVAAAGYRAADQGPLFLERYLSAAVQTLLPATQGREPCRGRVVEVGHLAAERAGEGRRLIGLLGLHLADEGFDWVVGTLTRELRDLFVRMGVAPFALGVADPARLGEQASQWGSYYDHRPQVLAGRLELALRVLARRKATA